MKTKTHDPLIEALADLSGLYPGMRLGQILAMVASFSGDEAPASIVDIGDERLFQVASDHIARRRCQMEFPDAVVDDRPPSESHAELLDQLQQARERLGYRQFGRFVAGLATMSGAGLYDVEDEELAASVRNFGTEPTG